MFRVLCHKDDDRPKNNNTQPTNGRTLLKPSPGDAPAASSNSPPPYSLRRSGRGTDSGTMPPCSLLRHRGAVEPNRVGRIGSGRHDVRPAVAIEIANGHAIDGALAII